ncbi:hypothetical protein JCM15765_02560 [Paradesulfitobacterium aromaticivorans]
MAEYVVLGYLKHNGSKLSAGDRLEIENKAEAAPLLTLGSIKPYEGKKDKSGKGNNQDPPQDPPQG